MRQRARHGDAGEIATAGTAADTPEPGQLSDERQRLTASLGELFDHQKAGVDAVANDAHGYQRKPAPAHISWGDLVSLAVSLGTAGVAGVVSKAIGGAIDGLAGDAAEEVTMAFATGLEQAARGAVATGPISGDASKSLASFFLAQTDMLVSAQGRLARRIIDGNAPLRRAYAADAPGTLTKMKGATAAVDAQHAEASAIQRAATTASLGRYLARAKLGSEVVRGAARGASMEATPIESLATHRAHAGGGADPKGEDGVLDLFIPVSAIGRPGSTVKEARLTGIGARVGGGAGRSADRNAWHAGPDRPWPSPRAPGSDYGR
jgi:hypothetical protein